MLLSWVMSTLVILKLNESVNPGLNLPSCVAGSSHTAKFQGNNAPIGAASIH